MKLSICTLQNLACGISRFVRALLPAFVFLSLASAFFGQMPERTKVVAAAEKVVAAEIASAPKEAPGCSVGVSLEGEPVFLKGFGMAELEHGVPIKPDSIFESGSVAKQFTAAALVLLEIDGKLDLDDPVRKYIPELPDYGAPLTIRHILNHTAGLRDWGAVMGLSGVGRGERIVRQDYAVHVITRQKHLDFVPGAEYSYSNSGYQLAAEIVERVSGMSLPEFTKKRIFDPMGMTNTSWRDDYERLVPRRVQAYDGPPKGPWKLSMPFMNVYGNGGLLTTSEDFLKWTAALDSGEWQTLADKLETQGVLNDGRKITYALGVGVSDYHGHRIVSHGGRTAGYVTYLVRFTDDDLALSVLCNAPFRNPARIAYRIVDEVLGPFPEPAKPEAREMSRDELQKYVGLWREEKTRMPERTTIDEKTGKLRAGGAPLIPLKDGTFQFEGSDPPAIVRFEFDGSGKRKSVTTTTGEDVIRFIAEDSWSPAESELEGLAGLWSSEEAETSVRVIVEKGKVKIRLTSLQEIPMIPVYKDHFAVSDDSIVWIERNSKGEIERLHVGTGRLRDIFFTRVK